MKKLTNHTPGPRGVTLKSGEVVWIKPGDTVELDADKIATTPDLGRKSDVAPTSSGDLDALTAQVADLTKQVDALTRERDDLSKDKADLTKQVETLTKPGK